MFLLKYLGSADPFSVFWGGVFSGNLFLMKSGPVENQFLMVGPASPPVIATSAHGSLPKLSLCATQSRVPVSNR